MSKRLDKEREKQFQPKRMEYALMHIKQAGYEISYQDETTLRFYHEGHEVTLFPYSGWHTGKSITDGRGIDKLLKQLHPA